MLHSKKNIIKEDYFFLLLILICAILVFSSFKYVVFHAGADEGYYLKYATVVSETGLKTFPGIFSGYISNQQDWVFPNPLRLAFILTTAVWVKIFGATYLALSSLSLLSYLLMLGVSYYFGKKYFGGTTALLFSILLGFSPLGMAMARRALLDAPANLFAAASLWMFFDMVEDRGRGKCLVFTICYALAILMKETAVLLTPIFIFCLLWRKYISDKEVRQNDFLSASIYPATITAGAYLLAAGSVSSVMSVARIIISSPATNTYAILYCSGSWVRYRVYFILISPWTLLLAAGFLIRYFLVKDKSDKTTYFVIVAVIYYVLLNLFAKNIRYAMLLDTPIRLFAVLVISEIADNKCGRYARPVTYLLVLAIAAYDYATFYKFFIINGIYDPVNVLMLAARGIVLLK